MTTWEKKDLYSYVARLCHKLTPEKVIEHLQQQRELLRNLVRKLPFRLPPCVDEDDLCQEIATALLRALRSHDPLRGNLEKHLECNVIREVRQWARRLNPLGRRRLEQMSAVNEAWPVLVQRNHRLPTVDELAAETGIAAFVVQRVLDAMEMRDILSLEMLANEADLPEVDPDPSEHACLQDGVARIEEVLGQLPPRERTLIRLHYEDGLSLREVASRLQEPKSTVIDLHRQTLLQLRGALAEGRPKKHAPPCGPESPPGGNDPGSVPFSHTPSRPWGTPEPRPSTWWARVRDAVHGWARALLSVGISIVRRAAMAP